MSVVKVAAFSKHLIMIRAEELMLGDWLKYGIDKIVKVTALYGSMIQTNVVTPLFPDDLEPIPITPEILKKNGFKQEDDDCYLWNENLERIIWFEDDYTVITSVKRDRVYEGHCNNIYELQHALRLCGITKNIEL